MEKSLIKFAGRLRSCGIDVSTAEILDAFGAIEHIGLEDRTVFKDALRAVSVKQQRDILVFDTLFDLFFSLERAQGPTAGPVNHKTDEDLSALVHEMLEMYRPDISLTTELVMTGQMGALIRLLMTRSRDMGLEKMESRLQTGFFTRKLRREMDLDRVNNQAESFLEELETKGLAPLLIESVKLYVQRNTNRVEQELRGLIQRELSQNRFLYIQRLQDRDLDDKRLAGLSEGEIQAMRPAVERLARRIKERLSLRLKKNRAGRFDLKTTLRNNIGLGGPLPYLSFRDRKANRPQVMALCDVSGSVRNFSRFMLLFLYTLNEVLAKVRSFIFVGDLVEVTDLFRRLEINEAVGRAAAGHGLTYFSRTDYGSSLTQFTDEFISGVNSKTTVFILGDARNNYYNPGVEALEAMSRKAKRVIWLNPEPQTNWRLGDSIMETYRPYCTIVAECGNLKQLSVILEHGLMP